METIIIDKLTLLVKYGLVDREDGTIFDTRTNLLWQQVSPDDTYTWEEAKEYCESLTLAGYNDWRLPTIEELKTLIVMEHKPTICPIFECKEDWYWSSSSHVVVTYGAWGVHFDDGGVHDGDKDDNGYVRAVRG